MKIFLISFFNLALIFASMFSVEFSTAQNSPPTSPPAPAADPMAAAPNQHLNQRQNNQKQGDRNKPGPGAVCKGDRYLYCKGITAVPDRRACLMKNKKLLTPACKEFIMKVSRGGDGFPDSTPSPKPQNRENKIGVNSPTVPPAKPAAKPAEPTPPAPAAPAAAPPEKKK